MAKVIYNTTDVNIEILDMGITVPSHGTFDLDVKGKTAFSRSKNLVELIGNGTLKLILDENVTPNTYYDVTTAIRILADLPTPLPISQDGTKLWVHESSKPEPPGKYGIYNTVWQGAGDDVENHVLAGGPLLGCVLTPGISTQVIDAHFDTSFGAAFIHEGYLQWETAGWGDYIDCEAISGPTLLQTFVNKDLIVDGIKIKYSPNGPGTGTHGFADIPALVPNLTTTGSWNYDGINLTPNFTDTGDYDLYTTDRTVVRFINRVPVYGTSYTYVRLQSADYHLIPPGWYLRLTAYNSSNTTWRIWLLMTLYRERTLGLEF